MRPLLHHNTIFQKADAIRILNRTKTVRNSDSRAVLRSLVERSLDLALRLRVQRRRDFVQE
jgi:hypothetical protein